MIARVEKLIGMSIASAIFLTACASSSPAPTAAALPTQASAVTVGGETAAVTVVPSEIAHLAFVIAGPVKTISVSEGQAVRLGQELIALDAPDQAYAVTAAAAALKSAQADEFIQSSGRKRWDGFKFVWAAGPPELRQVAVAKTLQAQAALNEARAELAQATLVAPFDGTVVSVQVAAGEVVQPGQVAVVIGNLSHLQVETSDLSERSIARIRIGQSAHVQLKALVTELRGKVIAISPLAGKSSDGDTVFKVTIELDQQPPQLLWGMTGDVRIDTR